MTYNVFGGTLNLAQSIHRIRVEFVYEGHRVKVKVTIAKWSQMPVHELINFHGNFDRHWLGGAACGWALD